MWVEASRDNAPRVIAALARFGAPLSGIEAADFEQPGTGFMMGQPPRRIDILTRISGMDFAGAQPRGITVQFSHVATLVIGLDDLERPGWLERGLVSLAGAGAAT